MRTETSTLLTVALLAGIAAPTAHGNIVLNPSFEQSPTSETFSSWVSSNVERMGPFIDSYDGNQSVDLAKAKSGFLQQQLITIPGETYQLEFYLSANIYSFRELPRQARVLWGGMSLGLFTWLQLGTEQPAEARFEQHLIYNLVAPTNRTILRFEDVSATSGFGAVLDAVSVTLMPEPEPETIPSPAALPGGILLGLAVLTRRKTTA
ncbi:MAG: hypothetical protein RLN76_00255 [Phycisphaeraceae bacterium]